VVAYRVKIPGGAPEDPTARDRAEIPPGEMRLHKTIVTILITQVRREQVGPVSGASRLGHYTILSSPILYSIWQPKGRAGGGGVVHCTMVVQYYCNSVGTTVGGRNARMIDGLTLTRCGG